jgi:hypothetical protein
VVLESYVNAFGFSLWIERFGHLVQRHRQRSPPVQTASDGRHRLLPFFLWEDVIMIKQGTR